jgi:hypothetical protein
MSEIGVMEKRSEFSLFWASFEEVCTTKRTKHAKDSEIIHFNFLLRALRDLRGKQNQVDNASLPIKKPQDLDFRKSITPILHFSIAYVCFFSLLASAFLMI